MKRFLFCIVFLGIMNQVSAQVGGIDSVKVEVPAELIRKTYKMELPKGWRVQDGCKDELCSLLSPADTLSYFDRFTENINITVNKLPSASYTVDKYASYSISYLPKVVKGFKLISKKKLKSNVYLIEYTGEKSNFNQTWKQYYYVKNSKVFIVTFASEAKNYDYYLPIVEASLKSFRLL
jgi:hypothetical protein